MRRALALPIVCALAIAAACGDDDEPQAGPADPDPELSESIIGTWLSEGGKYVTFLDDGTYQVGINVGTAEKEHGTWSVEGDILTKVTDSDSPNCEGIVATYESEIIDDGERLESTVIEDECSVRVDDFVILTRHADQ